MLQDMFGEDSVPRTFSGDRFEVEVSSRVRRQRKFKSFLLVRLFLGRFAPAVEQHQVLR